MKNTNARILFASLIALSAFAATNETDGDHGTIGGGEPDKGKIELTATPSAVFTGELVTLTAKLTAPEYKENDTIKKYPVKDIAIGFSHRTDDVTFPTNSAGTARVTWTAAMPVGSEGDHEDVRLEAWVPEGPLPGGSTRGDYEPWTDDDYVTVVAGDIKLEVGDDKVVIGDTTALTATIRGEPDNQLVLFSAEFKHPLVDHWMFLQWSAQARTEGGRATVPKDALENLKMNDAGHYRFTAQAMIGDDFQSSNQPRVLAGYRYRPSPAMAEVTARGLNAGTYKAQPGELIIISNFIKDQDERRVSLSSDPEEVWEAVPGKGSFAMSASISAGGTIESGNEQEIELMDGGGAFTNLRVRLSEEWVGNEPVIVTITVRDQGQSPDDLVSGTIRDEPLVLEYRFEKTDRCPDGLEVVFGLMSPSVAHPSWDSSPAFWDFRVIDDIPGEDPPFYEGVVITEHFTELRAIAGWGVGALTDEFLAANDEVATADEAAVLIWGDGWAIGSFHADHQDMFRDVFEGIRGRQFFKPAAFDTGVGYREIQTFRSCGDSKDLASYDVGGRLIRQGENVVEQFFRK
jgi:hypothetical protein